MLKFTKEELEYLLDHASDMVTDYTDEPEQIVWESIHDKLLKRLKKCKI